MSLTDVNEIKHILMSHQTKTSCGYYNILLANSLTNIYFNEYVDR